MGLMDWLLKGIGFEDEEDQEATTAKLEQKEMKKKLKEAKRKEREAEKLEKSNAKLEKLGNARAVQTSMDTIDQQSSYTINPDQFNISSTGRAEQSENLGGYGNNNYGNTYGANSFNGNSYNSGNIGGYGSKNVVFFYPKSYNEVQKLIDYLKQGESVMLNLDNISDAEAQRMLDFASGAVYAINGSIQRVSGNIFLLTPEGLNIMVPKG